MKPLSELVKEWRYLEGRHDWDSAADKGLEMCADELEAWLREADDTLDKIEYLDFSLQYLDAVAFFRKKLLGTTRREGEK